MRSFNSFLVFISSFVFFILFATPFAQAEKLTCYESQSKAHEQGQISLLSKSGFFLIKKDFCKDSKTLVKYSCDKEAGAKTKEILCDCRAGYCQ